MTWNMESMEVSKSSTQEKTASPSGRTSGRRPRSFAVHHRRSRPGRQYTLQRHRNLSRRRSSQYRKSIRRHTEDVRSIETQTQNSEDNGILRVQDVEIIIDDIFQEDDEKPTDTAKPASVRHSVHPRRTVRKDHSEETPSSIGSSSTASGIQFAPCYHHRRARNKQTRKMVQGRKRTRKIVIIGDMCCGKSSLISAYCRDKFSDEYVPTILNSCLTDARILGKKVDLAIVELSGRLDYARLRQCAYRKTDAVIFCYATDNSDSLESIRKYWDPELKHQLKHHAPKTPCILVGTKNDVRDDQIYKARLLNDTYSVQQNQERVALLEHLVSKAQVLEVARSINAHASLVCSALYRDRTRDVFEKAAEVALKKSRRRKKVQRDGGTCTVL